MTISPVASAVHSSSKTQFVEEISLVIAAQDLTPAILSLDFLKFSGIIDKDWELAQQPVFNPNFAQLNFTNGVNINAQPRTITINESLNNKKSENISIHQVAGKYLEKLPHAEYMGLSFSPKILLPFPNDPESVREYITGTLLSSGSWKHIGKAPVQANVNLMYYLERCQLTISVSEAKLQRPQEQPLIAILFSGNFNYNLNPAQEATARIAQMHNFLDSWITDLAEFREIVNQKFLDSCQEDETQSVRGTSLFPGQML